MDPIESYRDATFSCPDFRLHLSDCWGVLQNSAGCAIAGSSPAFNAGIMRDMGEGRWCESPYAADHSLELDDCAPPPEAVAAVASRPPLIAVLP